MAAIVSLVLTALLTIQHPAPHRAPVRPHGDRPSCGDPMGFQVLLDRRGFSPGEIDGTIGANAGRALSAFQQTANVAVTGMPDCDTWTALTSSDQAPITMTYTVTEEDVAGPFTPKIPEDLVAQGGLAALTYRTPLEEVAERFHVSPALLQRMNPRLRVEAGSSIVVPAVTPFDAHAKPARNEASDVTIEVSRDDSALRVIGVDGTIQGFAPVTTGSEHDPLPIGSWRVTSIDWNPVFHYNPALFWDANPKHSKATIKAGPNNPVGVVWIGINVEHYGLHGTPEPSNIGHTASHGCIRMTNWDAARIASLVKVGTPVIFK